MQLDDLHVLGPETRLLVDLLGGPARHVGARQVDAAALAERALAVGRHGLAGDLDGLGLHAVATNELLAGQHRGTGAVRRRAALQLGQRLVHGRRLEDLLERVLVAELRVRVVDRVAVVLLGDLGELLGRRAVALHVVAAGVAEHLGRRRRRSERIELDHLREMAAHRRPPVHELQTE